MSSKGEKGAVEVKDLALGALLYEIGRFKKRACRDRKGFREVGQEWLKKSNHLAHITQIMEGYELLIGEAAKLAAGLDVDKNLPEEPEPQEALKRPLVSVFSKVSLSREAAGKYHGCWRYYRPTPIIDRAPYPTRDLPSTLQEDYKALWNGFEEELAELNDPDADRCLVLLEKYASFIPYSPSALEEPHSDISLFDQMKITAAIASCLYLALDGAAMTEKVQDRTNKRYLLVGGDFSGVQRFIYRISSKGALKSLRARAFFMELLTEHVIHKILTRLYLSRANLIYSGGSRFTLLLPNTEKAKEVVEQVRREINGYFISQHEAKLYLVLEWYEMSGSGLVKRMSDGWQKLATKINERKRYKFEEELKGLLQPEEVPDECHVCHRHTENLQRLPLPAGEEEVKACPLCCNLYDLGKELQPAQWLYRSDKKPERRTAYIPLEGLYYSLYEGDTLKLAPVWRINSWDTKYYHKGVYPLLLANYTVKEGIDFEELAECSVGAKLIGTLRMDVDRLGDIFKEGLEAEEQTLTRYSALSRLLTLFFKFYMNRICGGDPESLPFSGYPFQLVRQPRSNRDVVVVYSGGDDLFIVGAWSEIAELAFDIHRAFKAYTCNNPDINLSGGMIVQDPHFPLYQFADFAGEAEHEAKANMDANKRKDSIALFYRSPIFESAHKGEQHEKYALKWGDPEAPSPQPLTAYGLRALIEQLVNVLGDGEKDGALALRPTFSRAFIYNLFQVVKTKREKGQLYLPKMVEALRRGGSGIESKRDSHRNQDRQAYEQFQQLKRTLLNANTINYLHPALVWLDLLVRKEEERR